MHLVLDLCVELLGQQGGGVEIDNIVDGVHLAHLHELGNDLAGLLLQAGSQLADGDLVRDGDLQLRVAGLFQLDALQALSLGLAAPSELLAAALVALVELFLLAGGLVLALAGHVAAVGQVVIAGVELVNVHVDGAGVNGDLRTVDLDLLGAATGSLMPVSAASSCRVTRFSLRFSACFSGLRCLSSAQSSAPAWRRALAAPQAWARQRASGPRRAASSARASSLPSGPGRAPCRWQGRRRGLSSLFSLAEVLQQDVELVLLQSGAVLLAGAAHSGQLIQHFLGGNVQVLCKSATLYLHSLISSSFLIAPQSDRR